MKSDEHTREGGHGQSENRKRCHNQQPSAQIGNSLLRNTVKKVRHLPNDEGKDTKSQHASG